MVVLSEYGCNLGMGKWVNLVQVASGDDRWAYQELIEVTDDDAEEMDVCKLLANIDDDL